MLLLTTYLLTYKLTRHVTDGEDRRINVKNRPWTI